MDKLEWLVTFPKMCSAAVLWLAAAILALLYLGELLAYCPGLFHRSYAHHCCSDEPERVP